MESLRLTHAYAAPYRATVIKVRLDESFINHNMSNKIVIVINRIIIQLMTRRSLKDCSCGQGDGKEKGITKHFKVVWSLWVLNYLEIVCFNGHFYLFHLSVSCSPGYFLDMTGCQACAVDQYQDQEAQTSCVPCPSGTSTLGQAASKRPEDCQGNL